MKAFLTKMIITVCGLLLCSVAVPAADTEPDRARLQQQIREMIKEGVPAEDADRMKHMMEQYNFQYQNMVRAQQTLIDAAKEGIPFEKAANKAYEGMAKNAPDAAIVQAMERTRQRYAFAYREARQVTSDQEQVRNIGNCIADGLQAGLQSEDADKIMLTLMQRTRQMDQTHAEELAKESFLAARTMARLGVPSSSVTDITCQALRNNYSAQKMNQLRNRFREDAMNAPPSVIADQYQYSLQEKTMSGNLGAGHQYGLSGENKGSKNAGSTNGFGGNSGSGASGGFGTINSGGAGSTGGIGATGATGGSSGSGNAGGTTGGYGSAGSGSGGGGNTGGNAGSGGGKSGK